MLFFKKSDILRFFTLIVLFCLSEEQKKNFPICPKKYDTFFNPRRPCYGFNYYPATTDWTGNLLTGKNIIIGEHHRSHPQSLQCVNALLKGLPWANNPAHSTRFLFEKTAPDFRYMLENKTSHATSVFCGNGNKNCEGWDHEALDDWMKKLLWHGYRHIAIKNLHSLYKYYQKKSFKDYFKTKRLRKSVTHFLVELVNSEQSQLVNQTQVIQYVIEFFSTSMHINNQLSLNIFKSAFIELKKAGQQKVSSPHTKKIKQWTSYNDWQSDADTKSVLLAHVLHAQKKRTEHFLQVINNESTPASTTFAFIGSKHLNKKGDSKWHGNKKNPVLIRKCTHSSPCF